MMPLSRDRGAMTGPAPGSSPRRVQENGRVRDCDHGRRHDATGSSFLPPDPGQMVGDGAGGMAQIRTRKRVVAGRTPEAPEVVSAVGLALLARWRSRAWQRLPVRLP